MEDESETYEDRETKKYPDCGPNAVAVEVEPSLSDEALEEIVQIAQKRAALIGDLKQARLQDDMETIKRVAAW